MWGHARGGDLQVMFGDGPADQPWLDATPALRVGFVGNGEIDALVAAIMSRIER